MEELLEKKYGPFNSNLKGPSLCGDVSRVDSELKQLLLRVELFLVRFHVYQQFSVLPAGDTFLLQKGLNLGEIRSMTSHVCCQNDSNEALSECLEVVPRKLLQKVVLSLIEDAK